MEEFMTKDRANYYSGITSITVNGKAANELKGKFLDDLCDNAFSETNREDIVKHIEYFLKLVDLIDLPNVNYERVRLVVLLISLVGDIKFKEFNHLFKVDMELYTHDIKRTKTYEDYETKLDNEVGEPWSKDGVPYELCDHIYEPFHFKNGKTKWPTYNSNEDGFCNGAELSRMVLVGYMTYFQDYEWYKNLTDSSLKEEGLKQKTIYEKSWGDATQSREECLWKINEHECSPFANWRDHIRGLYASINTTHDPYLHGRNGRACNNNDNKEKKEQHKEGRCDLFNDPAQEPTFCKIRRFEMIKYSFGQEEEYVAIKEYEYDDLTRTNEDACHSYQEIFRNMDEGWLVTRAN
nr:hypothetical protein [Tanacetum cinerariifolium]